MRYPLLLVFVLLWAAKIHAQQVPLIASQTYVFANKRDSTAYAKLDEKLTMEMQRLMELREYSKVDSVMRIRAEFLKGKEFFIRYYYLQDRSFTPYQLLPKIANKDSITRISVRGKLATRLPDSIYMYKNLTDLELIDFKLKKIPRKLMKKTDLKRIIISNNYPKKPLKLSKSKTVTTLVIRGDERGMLPTSYGSFKNLQFLNLSRNNIRQFPKVEGLKNLWRLDLTNNAITEIPARVSDCTNLRSLNLNNNSVASIQPGFEKLTKLEELSLYKNQLPELPSMIYSMTSLKVIDLYYNHIPKVSPEIGNLTKLEILYLANNEIYSLPDEIGKLTNLKELYLHHNKLSNLPASIGNLSSLYTLRINNNGMIEWPAGVSKLTALSNFDCSFNQFETLPIGDLDFKNMKILSLGGNPWDPKITDRLVMWVEALRANETVVHTDVKMLAH